MIRVAIAAASPVVRAGLESLIASSPGMEVAGAFADARGIDALRADVVLAADGVELPEEDAHPAVLLSAGGFTADRFHSGVRAVLPASASAAAIVAAVDAVAAGMAVIDSQELETLLSAPALQSSADAGPLTPRELEVLRMMAEGAANKAIAWKLGISEHTVKFHVASILGKLAAGTRTEAVTIGIRKGLVLI